MGQVMNDTKFTDWTEEKRAAALVDYDRQIEETTMKHAAKLKEYDEAKSEQMAIWSLIEAINQKYETNKATLDSLRSELGNLRDLLGKQKIYRSRAAGTPTSDDYDQAYELISEGGDPRQVRKEFQKQFIDVSNDAFRAAMYRRRPKIVTTNEN